MNAEPSAASEAILVVAFFLLPLALLAALVFFFRIRRIHEGATLRPLRLLAGNALVLAFAISILLLGGELYYRFIFDETDSFGLTKTYRRWKDRHVSRNESGIRDSGPRYELRVPNGKRRVSLIGDSFTVGHGVADVDDRFANLLRTEHPDWEVHLLARNGMDTGHHLERLKASRKAGYEMDVVVLVYVLNDISDIIEEWDAIQRRIVTAPDPGFLVNASYLFNTLYFRYFTQKDPDVASYYDFLLDGYSGEVWERQRRRLERLRNEIRSRNGDLLVVTFPFLHSLGPDNPYRPAHAKLDAFWKELGVPHLDLLGTFESHSADSMVVNRYDAHPNERAHAMAAEVMGEFIAEHVRRNPASSAAKTTTH